MTVYSVEWISNWFSWEIKQEIALSSICHYFLSLELAALRPVLFKISRIFYASNHLICSIIEVSPKCIDPATCQYNHIWNNQVWSDSIQQISSVRPPCTSPHHTVTTCPLLMANYTAMVRWALHVIERLRLSVAVKIMFLLIVCVLEGKSHSSNCLPL